MNDLTLSERAVAGMPMRQAIVSPDTETLDLVEYWRTLTKRKWSILSLVLLIAILATLIVFSIRPSYRSTAMIMIEQGKSKVISIEEVYGGIGGNREYYQTQVEIIKSHDLARKVVQKLDITNHPDYDPRQKAPILGINLRSLSPFADKVTPTSEDILKQVVIKFSNDLQVQAVRNSQLVQISFVSHDKELAAKVPNTLAELYIESDLEAKVAMTQKAGAWLTERLGELRKKLDASEQALQDYRERERIVDAKGVALSGAARALEEATKGLVEARAKRAEAENLYNQIQGVKQARGTVSYESIPAVLRHPLVQKFKELEAEAERKLSDASQRYGPEHPRMVQANAELAAAQENTRRQIQAVVTGVTKEYEVARANELAVERALGQSKAEIQGMNRKEFQLGVLEREAQANRQLYDMFVTRFKETNVAGDLQSTVARVVDPAILPGSPYAPKKLQIVSISAAVALLIGILLALLLDRINNTLNSTQDVEKRLGLPVLGVLQKIKGFSKKGFKSELAFFNDSQSVFSEAIRTVRTGVLMSSLDSQHKVLVVTSTVPEEGKTTVSFNLSCALAQVKKVLLIDADLRRPKIGRLLDRDKDAPGLSNMVAGTATPSQAIYFDEKAGFHILSAGTVPPNPLELLSSKRFEEVIDKLKEAFDMIVIDSPPVQLVSDALVLSRLVDSVVYVVRADSTAYQMAQNGIKRLRAVNAPLIGVVLNQLDIARAEKYYGEYSTYGRYKRYNYGYGHGYNSKTKPV